MIPAEPESVVSRSPKRYIQAALSAGFEVRCGTTKTFEEGAVFKGGVRAGEKRPDKEIIHLWVEGRVDKAAAFRLHFLGGTFSEAWIWDAAGWPTELYFDYAPSANELKQRPGEPDKWWRKRHGEVTAAAERQDREYNDGAFWADRAPREVDTAGELDDWLADLVPGFEPRKPAVKKTDTPATAEELIEMGEWNG